MSYHWNCVLYVCLYWTVHVSKGESTVLFKCVNPYYIGKSRGWCKNVKGSNEKCSTSHELCTRYAHCRLLLWSWISNHMHTQVWDEITYPFPNFNGCTVEVWEWISNFIPHFIMRLITYPTQFWRIWVKIHSMNRPGNTDVTMYYHWSSSIDHKETLKQEWSNENFLSKIFYGCAFFVFDFNCWVVRLLCICYLYAFCSVLFLVRLSNNHWGCEVATW